MLLSMTGYGDTVVSFGEKKIHVEAKSLNSKALDLQVRVAPLYRTKEADLRKMAAEAIVRGKAELNVWVERGTEQGAQVIDAGAVASYWQQMEVISKNLGLPMPTQQAWTIMTQLPGVAAPAAAEQLTEEEWAAVSSAAQEALAKLQAFRRQEGEALEHKFREKITSIAALMKEIEPYEASRVTKVKQRLEARLEELTGVDYDRGRLEQELIYYIEKLDISEEKQRLANHLRYFEETMAAEPGQGKKLGFIAQEMGREINTTGSKSGEAEMQRIVVRMKDELEQIKEQVLNVF